ncbi:type II toxin-antitoxin system RelE/ParE family toxin [Sulfurimonas sp.]|jgi:plasmid stabilization system protein ParE|uniref:type II toxin-antitoxin system RelE/ParE family toxin n=1 Tax=Sulfurimonas sp. TaxID=2022749 RepID=UPI0025D30132|nr:type II toxin-antitoxin system RelE/ParE family toxin [Sulfurimonas sp.]MBT5934344.1 type II toxin-antitoxin system RelE/ParE family toxin [Sulfurimonas sp.]
MLIVRTKYFILTLQHSLNYIAQDKVSAAVKFKKDLDKQINNLVNFPYKYRQSNYYENETIRDMTFKAYTIIYKIKEDEKIVEILEIFHKNLPLQEEK